MSAFRRIQALSETISMARRRKGRPVSGVLLLDKPKGPSSNQALQTAKRLFGAAKAGHTGNLDPMASGVLPICFGEATKLSQYLLDADKQYVTELVLGQSTDTGDAEGSVIREADASLVSRDRLEAILPQFIGPQEQVPPMYSAIKVDGQPLYKRARKGEVVERSPERSRSTRSGVYRFSRACSPSPSSKYPVARAPILERWLRILPRVSAALAIFKHSIEPSQARLI